jgi:cytochrome c oxidase subunit 2
MHMAAKPMILLFALSAFADFGTGPAHATPPAPPCSSCHGERGEGNQAQGAPRLAGQDAAYLARQMTNFKTGRRGYREDDKAGARMRAVAAALSDADIQNFAAQYGKMDAAAIAVQNLDAAVGKELYNSTCSACHGPRALGFPQLQSPNLRILGDWYVVSQIDAYAKGWRGTAEGTDLPTLWMRSIATHVSSPKDLAAVAHYMEALPAAASPQ